MRVNSNEDSHNGRNFNRRLATYLSAAGAAGTVMASEAKAVVVGNNTLQPFGINGVVSIDFNSDGQTDFQIDHDRVDMTAQSGPIVDYLQIDKNDINGETNPLAFDPGPAGGAATPFQDGVTPRNDANESAYLVANPGSASSIEYPSALPAGAFIGPGANFDWQEGDNVRSTGDIGRLNRLADEDHGQVDMILGGKTAADLVVPSNAPQFPLDGQVRYLGLKMDLNGADTSGTPVGFNYGWIGVRITSSANLTGEVVGYAYETVRGVPILAGVVPEPGTFVTALVGAAALFAGFIRRRVRR
jgi:hypothetical protein